MKRYNPSEIEPKWQKIWEEKKAYKAEQGGKGQKIYLAEMFPYPSGAGLHVGHVRNFTIVDVLARFHHQQGCNVLRTIGWDTFGLPAENYAIKTGISPQKATKENIENFKNQFKRLGMATDWDREINTSHPEYYRWTQWVFTRLYEKGLAYQAESAQWWCPVDKTVLANEQVEGACCWRCGAEVEKKMMKQWFFKITAYADELLDEIDGLDWPEKIKTMQKNWIGRSKGAEIEFKVDGQGTIKVFTTRPDTIYGATFMVLAPEHGMVDELTSDECRAEVEAYRKKAAKKSEIERQENKEKTGVFTGGYVINPVSGEKMPVWVADYVLMGYGEGAIMAVPAHDERDFEFAKKYELPISEVVRPYFIDERNPVRTDKEYTERRIVSAVVHDVDADKFLCIKWQKFPWTSFVIGGVEPNEDVVEAAKREVLEETGYDDIEFRRVLGDYGAEFYAANKGVNRKTHATAVLFELKSHKQVKVSDEEMAIQKPVWLKREEIKQEDFPAYDETMLALARMDDANYVWTGEGVMVNSGEYDGKKSSEVREEIVKRLKKEGVGRERVTYKMRDWLISRQRYWGAPIPVAYDKNGEVYVIPEDQLPVMLPDIDNYEPDDSGKSALAKHPEWTKVVIDGEEMTRETDTMDGYACSSWYLLRYCDPRNSEKAWGSEVVNYWNPLDFYVGGDHAVAHLLYVRFWCKFFADEGLVGFREPVKRLLYNGYINAPDGKKMSKSKGNVIDPLDLVDQGYGADALRTYEMFIGPYELDAAWDPRGIGGVYRFLNRVWTITQEYLESEKKSGSDDVLLKIQHQTVKRVTEDLHRNSFNTPVAALMEYVNELYKLKTSGFGEGWQEALEVLVRLLAPFAPHVAAELFEQLGHSESIEEAEWPTWDERYLVASEVEIVVQVNGKLRGKVMMAAEDAEDEGKVKEKALGLERVKVYTEGKKILKFIFVKKNRLVNIVVGADY